MTLIHHNSIKDHKFKLKMTWNWKIWMFKRKFNKMLFYLVNLTIHLRKNQKKNSFNNLIIWETHKVSFKIHLTNSIKKNHWYQKKVSKVLINRIPIMRAVMNTNQDSKKKNRVNTHLKKKQTWKKVISQHRW